MINNDEDLDNSVSKLLALEWKLFPIHGIDHGGACTCGKGHTDKSAGKHPVHGNWNATGLIQEAVLDQSLLAFKSWNVGANCKTSGFFVIDIDPRNGGDESFISLESLLEGEIPSTVASETGQYLVNGRLARGRHLYFKCDASEELIGNLTKMGFKGIDIKHNGYVLLPPSSHITGVGYQWVAGKEPWTIQMAEPSDALWDLLRKKNLKYSKKTPLLEHSPIQAERARGEAPATPYATEALANEAKKIRQLRLGANRNDALNASAFRMGRLMAEGQIGYEECKGALAEAGREAFFGEDAEDEIQNVLRAKGGGFESGFNSLRFKTTPPPAIPVSISEVAVNEEEFVQRMNEVDWHKLWADESEEEWLVPGIICDARGHTWYSEPGIGKSLMIREMSACLATGKSVFGFPSLDQMSILYIDFENIPRTDIKRSLVDMGFTAEELTANFHLFSFPEFSPFDHPRGGRELERVLDIFKPRLVIIDTASRTVAGKENDNDTWINFYNHTGKLLKSKGIAYIRIDHTGKNAEAGPRGGSAKKGDVDLVWYLKQVVKEKSFKIINEKHRVPITNDVYEITRELAPLRHVIVSSVPWGEYVEVVLKFDCTIKLIEDFMSKNPAHPTGLKSLWDALREECKTMGVTRKTFDEARNSFLEGLFD